MQQRMIELINYLRQAGFSISTGETMDLTRSLPLVGLNRSDLITASLCTLAKDKTSYHQLSGYVAAYLQDLKENQTIIPSYINVPKLLNNPPRLPRSEFLQRQDNIKKEIRNELAAIKDRPQTSSGVMGRCGTGTAGMGTRGHPTGLITDPMGMTDQEKNNHFVSVTDTPTLTNLRELDIARANQEQLDDIKKSLISLGKRLAIAKGYRKKPWPTGSVDMRRTVARAISHNGIPLVLRRQRRAPSQPKIMLLCDLSGSVAPYSEFMLQLLIGLQQRFKRLRSFAFVDHVAEVTYLAKTGAEGFTVTAQKILREAKISKTGFSHYGLVWAQFQQNFAHHLNRDITLMVLGDARNNWQTDGLEYFRVLAGQCGRLLWLNPMPQEKWHLDDCILGNYIPYCTGVFECRNANQLGRVIRSII